MQDESHLSCVALGADCCCHEHTTSVLVAVGCVAAGGVGVCVGGDGDGGFVVAVAADVTADFMGDICDGGMIVGADAAVVWSVDVLSAAAIVAIFSPTVTVVNDVSGVADGLSSNCEIE